MWIFVYGLMNLPPVLNSSNRTCERHPKSAWRAWHLPASIIDIPWAIIVNLIFPIIPPFTFLHSNLTSQKEMNETFYYALIAITIITLPVGRDSDIPPHATGIPFRFNGTTYDSFLLRLK